MNDGRSVAYSAMDGGRFVGKQSLADGSGTPKVFVRTGARIRSVAVGPPNTFMVVEATRDLLIAPLDSPSALRECRRHPGR